MSSTSPALITRLLHADDDFAESAVAPAIAVSTTYRHILQEEGFEELMDIDMANSKRHVYSRYTNPVSTRAEKVLGQLCNGHAICYSSGLSASFAALTYLNPKRVAIRAGYHGCHESINVYRRAKGDSFQVIDIDDEFREGDLCWLETPLNPTGEARDIKHYADKVHAAGGKLLVDSTFAPPPLQDPFKWGTDFIMHSGTKYFGGHSDLLCGVLVVKSPEEWRGLWNDRTFLGNVLGSLESFLLLRSLRTLNLRILRQSETAAGLVQWLYRLSNTPAGADWDGAPGGIVTKVWHTTLQNEAFVKEQVNGNGPACFAILLDDAAHAKTLPFTLSYFTHATSLGGVESLIEHRRVSDQNADPRLLRISVGLEDLEDLKGDLRRAFWKVANRGANGTSQTK